MQRTKGRGNGEGSVYQRADGKWCAAVSIDGGKRKVLYGRTRKEVADKLATVLPDVKRGLPIPRQRLSTATYLGEWLENSVKPNQRANTYHVYEIAVRLHLVPALGRRPLAKLTPADVQALQAGLAAKKLTPATVLTVRAVLSGALSQAEKWGLVARNVVKLVDPPRQEYREPKVLTPEQAAALTEAARGHDLEHLFSTMLSTGLRVGEALGLRWDDVDLDASTPVLHVRQQMLTIRGKGRTTDEPKSRTGRRTVPLIGKAVEALRGQKDHQAFRRRTARDLWHDNGLVFPDELGELMTYERVRTQFRLLCGAAEIPAGYTPHCLRHSTGTFLTAAGVPDRVVMEILGHSSTDMTRRYQHVMGAMLEDAGRRLDAFFSTGRAVNE
jgi:integrase